LQEALVENFDLDRSQLIICCPDRMIENWILADTVFLHKVYDVQVTRETEGQNGKSFIKRLLGEKGITYHEPTIGVEMLCNVDPLEICKRSESFRRLRSRVEPYCRWLRGAI